MTASTATTSMNSASKKCVHIAGFNGCGFFARAMNVLRSLSILFPNKIQVIEHGFSDRTTYRQWLLEGSTPFRNYFPETSPARKHSSSPFVWFTKTTTSTTSSTTSSTEPQLRGSASTTTTTTTSPGVCDPADIESFLGGHDDTLEWCRSFLSVKDEDNPLATKTIHVDDGYTKDHMYDYDLIVIGGGSGGMAAAKEAAAYGAKVALLDYVKPSPAGTSWGLGGTCVNVGCIPKKLFHIGSLLRESIHADTAAFGIRFGGGSQQQQVGDNNNDPYAMKMIPEPTTTVDWEILRENIQNYIRGLNFKYRVRLREKQVTYVNKLAKFVDEHTIEAIDKKGNTETMTASRFLIAVGGRPSPLECEGGELSISSDDIFGLEQSPGKTLCIGASYISLECAGFLAGLSHDVTIAVRSILLRGFDRECTDKIGQYMEQMPNIKFKKGVVPIKLTQDGTTKQIHVEFSDGTSDSYDTVLTAIGRTADTAKLGIDKLGMQINPKNKKIIGKYEQTNIPNIYAVGDVLDDTPELTPVAIQAGVLLARRLFGGSNIPMDYINVCTTVFTPIEYACVGYSEDDAIEKFGASNIEVYHREFLPLEWSLSMSRNHHNSFAKIIVDKQSNEQIIGIHYVGPNAGEVMQGYGVAIKKGITYKELFETVGIHPTSAEEIVTLSITKSSGEDAAAGGC